MFTAEEAGHEVSQRARYIDALVRQNNRITQTVQTRIGGAAYRAVGVGVYERLYVQCAAAMGAMMRQRDAQEFPA